MTDESAIAEISIEELRLHPKPLAIAFEGVAAVSPPYPSYLVKLVGALVSDLCAAENHRRFENELYATALAISACATFIEALPQELLNPQISPKEISFPLHRLRLELSDLVTGRKSALLAPQKVASRRKLSLITMFRRAVVVAAIDDLMEIGISESAATKAVMGSLKKASITAELTLRTVRNDFGDADPWILSQRAAYREKLKSATASELELRLEKMLAVLRLMRTAVLE